MNCCAAPDVHSTAGNQEAASLLVTGRVSHWRFFTMSAALFVVSSTATIAWCGSLVTTCGCGADLSGCPLATSMWRPGPGQGWPGVAAEFLAMWSVMMVAMMLPSLMPRLWRYRQAVAVGAAVGAVAAPRLGWLTVQVGMGYFAVWTLVGAVVFPLGAVLSLGVAALPGLAGVVPFAVGAIVLLAGALQFTTWKARQLACCREPQACERTLVDDARAAWRHGLRLGLHCVRCCAGLTAMLLVIGMMDLRAMAAVTLAITLERLLPRGERVARAVGAVIIVAGMWLIARAAGLV